MMVVMMMMMVVMMMMILLLSTSSEQLELEHIGTLQAEVALRRRQNEASYRAALAGRDLCSACRLLLPRQPDDLMFSSIRASLQEEEEAPPAFRATRLPRKMLEGVVVSSRPAVRQSATRGASDPLPPQGVPERKLLLPTVPESPAFSLKRLRPQRELEVKPLPPVLRAAPPPHAGVPFQPRLPESRQVEVCPFSFEERDRERRSLKERTLQELRHGEVAPFKAQPLPSFDSVLLPEKKTLAPTRPEPFRLQVEQRGALRSALREQQVKDEQRREEGAAFRARPNTVTHKEAFQPRKEARPPVVVEAFQLSTERRAAERQEFEQQAGAREALGRLQEERQRQEQEQEEKEEVARLRREQVHAAQPIRHYRAVAVKKSELPLTVPHSPNFSDRFRL
ncbi:Targeting protein for Xklp2-A [Liparis tanakae]|uniref:Targeting protein for Xklp2-A n=1 Tax=Liparis tanakae TaxID=230148 RepID=A0A4Z2EG65_9TELE|nr:Targeting protein for Xklp2-A [Liparis tanakae]